MTSFVYFIQAVSGGPIKIGVGVDPARRLMALQPGNPERLRIIGVIRDAGREQERNLHFKFRASRMHGEWFEPSPELLAFIESTALPFDPNGAQEPKRPAIERSALGVKVRHLRLRELRLQHCRSVSDVAAEAGISVQYLSFIERGERRPLPPVFDRICAALGVDGGRGRRELILADDDIASP